jgi:4-alpha-glucanotransferase
MDLLAQARIKGVQSEFVDALGKLRVTDPAALKSILDALPEKRVYRFVDGPVVVRALRHSRTELAASGRVPLKWKITGAAKVIAQGETREPVIAWPSDLPLGYHRLTLTDADGASEEVPMIVAPERAFGGDFDRGWLLAVQLYSIRSGRNWGIGDFTDLAGLVRLAKQLGADGVGLNPLHALFDDRPADCSPYSPNSRLFLNALYIDVEKAPGYQGGIDRAELKAVRQSEHVDYKNVAALKWPALRAAFAAFRRGGAAADAAEFAAYRAERGELLERFCCFEVLRHRFNQPWWEWPQEWRQPDAARLAVICCKALSAMKPTSWPMCNGLPSANCAHARSSPAGSA